MNLSIIEEELRNKDSKLKKIIDENGHISFKPNDQRQFNSLFEIVISQFISTVAAKKIILNFQNNFNSNYLNERNFENLTIKQIKNLGVSTNKAKTIKQLSENFLNKNLLNLTELSQKELYNKLISIFGIGPWSINMFEIFCIGNLNIFSSRDAGLRLAMNKANMVKPESDWADYDHYAEKWSPYKSIASLHLWKKVD